MTSNNGLKVGAKQPSAVFICNSPLHVYNALQAAEYWGLDTSDCILVLKVVSEKIQLTSVLENLATWHSIIRIDPFPLPPRLKEKGNIKRYIQYKFFKRWQKELDVAKGCRYVFLCHNRQNDNKVIASYIDARELIWLEDGTLSYFLWQEERLLPAEQRNKSNKPKASAKPKVPAKPNASAKPSAIRNAKVAQNKRADKASSASKASNASSKKTTARKNTPVSKTSSAGIKKTTPNKSVPVKASTRVVKSKSLGKPKATSISKPRTSTSSTNRKKPVSKSVSTNSRVGSVSKSDPKERRSVKR